MYPTLLLVVQRRKLQKYPFLDTRHPMRMMQLRLFPIVIFPLIHQHLNNQKRRKAPFIQQHQQKHERQGDTFMVYLTANMEKTMMIQNKEKNTPY